MTTQYDEAYMQSEVDHAKREAKKMIVDHLLQYANDHRPYTHQEGCLEGPLVLAIDHVSDELVAWVT
jgi:hypothetical protein